MKNYKSTNYVKVLVAFNGTITSLFVKENNTYEMLKALRDKHSEKSFYNVSTLSVSMRKVRIENRRAQALPQIIENSFKKVQSIF